MGAENRAPPHEETRSFYEAWARRQAEDPARRAVLAWKADRLATLAFRHLREGSVASVGEVGGAEGSVLAEVGARLGAGQLVNYEPAETFCRLGRRLHPGIEFVTGEFTDDAPVFDVIVLSDIIEHVPSDASLLELVARRGRHVLLKIPLERCLLYSPAAYRLRGKPWPDDLRFGPGHVNGHLRGYTARDAARAVRPHFRILEARIEDVTRFHGPESNRLLRRCLGARLTTTLLGGAYYAVARSRALESS